MLKTVALLNILVETIIYFLYILWYIESKKNKNMRDTKLLNINNVFTTNLDQFNA